MTLPLRASRTKNAFPRLLNGLFSGVTLSSILVITVFWGSGSYHNFGSRGVWFGLLIILRSFLLGGFCRLFPGKEAEPPKAKISHKKKPPGSPSGFFLFSFLRKHLAVAVSTEEILQIVDLFLDMLAVIDIGDEFSFGVGFNGYHLGVNVFIGVER